MTHRMAILALLLAAPLLAGCSTLHDPDPFIVPADTAPLAAPTLHYRVGILPVFINDEFRATAAATNKPSSTRWVYVPDPEWCRAVSKELAEVLGNQLKCAESVVPIGEGRNMQTVLRDAWDADIDLVIRPVLHKRDCSHVSSNGAHVPALILWIAILQALTWGIADETFASDTDLQVEFWPTGRPDTTPAATRSVTAQVKHDLDDLQQGFNLFNVFITPSGMSAGQWEDIGKNLLPLSRQASQRAFVKLATASDETGFASDLRSAAPRMRTTMALLCGVSPAGGQTPHYAQDDMARIDDVLQHGLRPSPCVPYAVHTINGLQATPDKLLAEVQSLLGRGREGDRLLLCLSARGVLAPDGKAYLMLAGSDAFNPAGTALSLDALAAALAALRTPVTLIASVSWESGNEPTVAPKTDPLAELVEQVPGLVVLAASDVPGELLEIDHARSSLFIDEVSRVLLDAAAADSDAEADQAHRGKLTVRELADAIRKTIRTMSGFAGSPHDVMLAGEDLDRVLIDIPPAAAATSVPSSDPAAPADETPGGATDGGDGGDGGAQGGE